VSREGVLSPLEGWKPLSEASAEVYPSWRIRKECSLCSEFAALLGEVHLPHTYFCKYFGIKKKPHILL
jgi:hypothetical protein